jgi:RNA-directed DNA polymerase
MVSKRSVEAEVPARVAATGGAGQKPRTKRGGAELGTATSGRTKSEDHTLMEEVVERSNLAQAYQRVVKNKGAPGVDDVSVPQFKDWLKMHWPSVKIALLEGRYLPRPVRRVDIPKPSGGTRTLGVPTLVDRLIQQALHQVPQPLFEPTFSDSSFGFRSGRGAHQAVRKAQGYIREGKRWVVDIDLEKFFDRVNHDVLMARVARQVSDVRVLKLIRRFLEAGLMSDGLVEQRTEGTPQGGPLFPLLSNVLLNDLDHELERRQLAFCRYADDCNIYVRSCVARTIEDLNPLLRGWITYFRLTETKGVLEELDGWLRRRLRCLLWRQWLRRATRARKLRALGLDADRARRSASNGHGPWWNAGASHMNQALPAKYFTAMGLVSLLGTQQRLQSLS